MAAVQDVGDGQLPGAGALALYPGPPATASRSHSLVKNDNLLDERRETRHCCGTNQSLQSSRADVGGHEPGRRKTTRQLAPTTQAPTVPERPKIPAAEPEACAHHEKQQRRGCERSPWPITVARGDWTVAFSSWRLIGVHAGVLQRTTNHC